MKALLRACLRGVLRCLFRVEVKGDLAALRQEHLLVVANHESFLDGLLLALFLPIDPVFVIHKSIASNWVFRLIVRQVEHLLVDPSSPMAVKTVIHLISTKRPVVIFPEGRISDTGSLMKMYDGPAFVAVKSGAQVVPVRLSGTARTYFSRQPRRYPRALFPRVCITILPARTIAAPVDNNPKDRHHHAGEAMRQVMQEMMFRTRAPSTLYDTLVDCAQLYGRRKAMVEDVKGSYSYGDLLRMALMLGRLMGRHSRQGEHIAVLMPNVATTLGLLFGLTAFRRVPALLNYTSGSEGMQSACTAVGAKTLVTSRAFIAQAELQDKVAALRDLNIIYLEDLRPQLSLTDKLWWIGYARWFPRAAASPGRDPEQFAALLFTSGSEGKPKGVAVSHRAILSNIAQMHASIDYSVEDKFFNALPMFHAFGLTAGTLVPLLSGARLYLYTSPLHYRQIPELIYDTNCTVLLGTATFLASYARHAHPYDFFRLRHVISGAEKLPQSVRDLWFERFGVRLLEGYGATETGPVLSVNTIMAYRSGSVGQLLPCIEHRLTPIPGIAHGGTLHVRGPNMMSGYFHVDRPGELEPIASELGAGWYNTGDVVDVDSDGFLHIVGRVKRFAKIAGEMVSLETVERIALTASPDFAHASSTQSDPKRGENLVLFTTDQALSRERLLCAARQLGLPELAIPRRIVARDELPLLGSGKTDYVTLKQLAEAGEQLPALDHSPIPSNATLN